MSTPRLRVGLGFDAHTFGGDGPLCSAVSRSRTRPGSPGTPTPTSSRTRSPTRCSAPAVSPTSARSFPHPTTDTAARRRSSCWNDVMARIVDLGWAVANVDVVIAAEQPPLAAHVGAMGERLGRRRGRAGGREAEAHRRHGRARARRRHRRLGRRPAGGRRRTRRVATDVAVRIHDTLAASEGSSSSLRDPGRVSMYVCGPTVYDHPHIGHGRTAVVFDVIRRYLAWTGLEVRFVSNVTDVDDKIIARAAGARHHRTGDRREQFEATYWEQMERVGVSPARRDAARHGVHRVDDRLDRRARRRRTRIRGRRHGRVLRRGVVPDLRRRSAPDPGAAARVGRRARRGRRGQAQPGRLRALEGGEARRTGLGLAVGPGPAGLAHRVLGDVARPARRRLRPARRWRRPHVPAPRERARAGGGRRACVRPPLDPLGDDQCRRREDVEVVGQLPHPRRRRRHPRRPGVPAGRAPDALPKVGRARRRGARDRRERRRPARRTRAAGRELPASTSAVPRRTPRSSRGSAPRWTTTSVRPARSRWCSTP